MKTNMNIFKQLLSVQLGCNYIDRSARGRGNKAARRAISTARGIEHLEFASEDTYTDRPAILNRGALLLIVDKAPHMRIAINNA